MIEKVKVPAFSDQVKGVLIWCTRFFESEKAMESNEFLYSTTSTAVAKTTGIVKDVKKTFSDVSPLKVPFC